MSESVQPENIHIIREEPLVMSLFKNWTVGRQMISSEIIERYEGRQPTKKETSGFSTELNSYIIEPPEDASWSEDPKKTGQAVLLRQGLLEASIKSMRGQSELKNGRFAESGGVMAGVRCVSQENDFVYAAGLTYIPLPVETIGVSRDGAQLNFSPESWSVFVSEMDRLQKSTGQDRIQLSLPIWVHCHPGTAFASADDRRVQAQSNGWYGVVVGRKLLNSAPKNKLTMDVIKNAIAEQQLHVIADNCKVASLGMSNPVTMVEDILGIDILKAHKLPEIFDEDENPELLINIIEEPDKVETIEVDLPPVTDTGGISVSFSMDNIDTDVLNQIKISESDMEETGTIVVTDTDMADFTITIRNIKAAKIVEILEQLKRWIGFV